jgi:hypothetical protein
MGYHNMKVMEINCETGEEILREATKAELDQAKLDSELVANEQAEAEARATQKAALLERLGITEDEAKLLLG